MNRKKELAMNTVILAVGKICTQLINFFLLPLYTSLLTTDDCGMLLRVMIYLNTGKRQTTRLG